MGLLKLPSRYISGVNEARQEIEMTAPVLMQKTLTEVRTLKHLCSHRLFSPLTDKLHKHALNWFKIYLANVSHARPLVNIFLILTGVLEVHFLIHSLFIPQKAMFSKKEFFGQKSKKLPRMDLLF